MLLVCYTNHFNHRICRVLEEPLTPPLPALRFKVAIHLQLHSVCWIPYVHFHFFWRSHSIPRSTDERKAWLVHQLENRVNFPARRKNPDEHPLHAHMYYKLEWDNCRSMLATIDSSFFVSLSKQLVQMSDVTFTQGFHSHFLFAHLSRPWSIGWVALSFLFVRSSRYGNIQPNLHFYFP